MNTHKSLITNGVTVLAMLVALLLVAGLTQAQGPGPEGKVQPQGGASVAVALGDAIPIQGRLTDASGNPLTGNYNMTFSLYDVASGGVALCSYNNPTVAVANGLFAVNLTGCANDKFNGAQLYLGVTVGADPEMDTRQPIYAVPYARSLRPGARIGGSGAGDGNLYMYDSNGEKVFEFNAAVASTYLGGNGEQGKLYINNDAGQYAVALSGNGYLNLGGNGENGHITVRGASSASSFTVDGSTGKVSQVISGTGLVKAGVYAYCANSGPFITNSFNNVVGTTITIAGGASAGKCTIDFGFNVFDRYYVATSSSDAARLTSCYTTVGDKNKLNCANWDTNGAGQDGPIMVLVY